MRRLDRFGGLCSVGLVLLGCPSDYGLEVKEDTAEETDIVAECFPLVESYYSSGYAYYLEGVIGEHWPFFCEGDVLFDLTRWNAWGGNVEHWPPASNYGLQRPIIDVFVSSVSATLPLAVRVCGEVDLGTGGHSEDERSPPEVCTADVLPYARSDRTGWFASPSPRIGPHYDELDSVVSSEPGLGHSLHLQLRDPTWEGYTDAETSTTAWVHGAADYCTATYSIDPTAGVVAPPIVCLKSERAEVRTYRRRAVDRRIRAGGPGDFSGDPAVLLQQAAESVDGCAPGGGTILLLGEGVWPSSHAPPITALLIGGVGRIGRGLELVDFEDRSGPAGPLSELTDAFPDGGRRSRVVEARWTCDGAHTEGRQPERTPVGVARASFVLRDLGCAVNWPQEFDLSVDTFSRLGMLSLGLKDGPTLATFAKAAGRDYLFTSPWISGSGAVSMEAGALLVRNYGVQVAGATLCDGGNFSLPRELP